MNPTDDRELLDMQVRALFARDVTAGWARLVAASGAAPLYSTSWENTASQSVARKLGLVQFASDFHVT